MNYGELYPFWDKLTKEEQAYLEKTIYTESYERGAIIHRSEENCKGLIVVNSGQLRTYVLSDEGRDITLFRVQAGEVCVLSASCVMECIEFETMIEAMEETVVTVLPAIYLNQIMKKNPYVEIYIYKAATEKFSDVMWTLQQILFKRIDQRIAQFVWDESVREGSLSVSYTHEEIAKHIGSAREVVTKVLKNLQKDGVVELQRGKILILDKAKLRDYL